MTKLTKEGGNGKAPMFICLLTSLHQRNISRVVLFFILSPSAMVAVRNVCKLKTDKCTPKHFFGVAIKLFRLQEMI